MTAPLQVPKSPRLPSVADSNQLPDIWVQNSRATTARSRGTHVHLRNGSAVTNSTFTGSLRQSVASLDPFNSLKVNDLTNYAIDDQRWTLQRKKIGLKRRTRGTQERRVRNLKTRDINISFIRSHFSRVECLRYARDEDREGKEICHCGLTKEDHIPPTQLLKASSSRPRSSGVRQTFNPVLEDPENESLAGEMTKSLISNLPFGFGNFAKKKLTKRSNALAPMNVHDIKTPPPTNYRNFSQDVEEGVGNNPMETILLAHGITSRGDRRRFSSPPPILDHNSPFAAPRVPPVDSKWTPETHYRMFPTDAYGKIEFVNETAGSNKPSKYVRLAKETDMQSVLTLLADYWRMLDPHRPQLVISVTGGAKNFKLDGKKKETFSSGLIKAVKSTNAWILTGGMHVGVMKSVGEAVNQGQYIVKVKRKTFFDEEEDHMLRGIRCLGIVPWGYIRDRDLLINSDPNDFSTARYKIHEKTEMHEPVSLNGDHTHFLFVDNGSRNSFTGSDAFRTRLEEAIQAGEPVGFGVPVVMLLLEGGMSSIGKCSMALKKNIPVVVVAGTGRAADLLAYAVSMTIRTPSGSYVMRKGHRTQIKNRISLTMTELSGKPDKQKVVADLLIECCSNTNMITIFDINSNESMDKYILYALLTGGSETSRLDQLNLALLWNRPDIAEQAIFPAQPDWPSGALEDLMTTALLEEKVEFVNLLIINGLVVADYLTVSTLRSLYNRACQPNNHLSRLLQRSSRNHYHHLTHVHKILQAMMKKHHDSAYTIDTPQNLEDDPSINYITFEDPYQELMLWAIFSRRGLLARYLWERCSSPISAAIAASAIYLKLWKSLGAKNTDIREEYQRQKVAFERLACELLEICYREDVINSMGLMERRNAKWGQMDTLEMAVMANAMLFVSTPCAQATIELNWRRGMVKAPSYAVIMANFLPLLVFWTKLFRFQRLGDSGGELSRWQKLFVFYKSPISKFFSHSTSFVCFLLLYSYVILFDFEYDMSLMEKLLLFWMFTYIIEEIAEIATERSSTLRGKITDWASSVWNRFDMVALFLALVALGLRLHRPTFKWGRIAYAINTTVFYCRLFRIYHVNYHLGPKLVIFYRMISEVLVFMALLVIFILGYGIASQALLHPVREATQLNITSVARIFQDVLLTPYWQMYGELLLDELQGDEMETCHQQSCRVKSTCDVSNVTQCVAVDDCICENSGDYTWVVMVMLFFYLIIGNIMLLNLLIAIFTYVFDEVQENSMEIWKFEMYRLIREFDLKPGLVPPFVVVEHFWRLAKKLWKLFCRKKKENLDEYMQDTLVGLRIFEKEATMTYTSTLAIAEEESIDKRVKRMSEKIDKISKYIEQKEDLEEIEEDLEWVLEEAERMKSVQLRSSESVSPKILGQRKQSGRPAAARKRYLTTTSLAPLAATPIVSEGEEEVGEEEDDVLGDELSDEDIEKELAHLQEIVSSAIGTPRHGLSRPVTASLANRRGREQIENLSIRLETLETQVKTSHNRMENMMKTIMSRLDNRI